MRSEEKTTSSTPTTKRHGTSINSVGTNSRRTIWVALRARFPGPALGLVDFFQEFDASCPILFFQVFLYDQIWYYSGVSYLTRCRDGEDLRSSQP